jgi:PhnB protein
MKIPEGHQTIMPYIIVESAEKFVAFLKRVFGAREKFVVHQPDDGSIMHAEYTIGTSTVMLANSTSNYKACPAGLYIYVENTDDTFEKAVKAGVTVIDQPSNKEYGRTAGFKDEFGNTWWIVTPL